MFLFTTTTLINSLKDYTTGKALISVDTDEDTGVKTFRVKRLNPFKLDDCHRAIVYKSVAKEGKVDSINVSSALSGLTADTNYRLAMYINSVGNADPMYANDFVFKGKPVYVEFMASGTAANDAAKLVENGNKYATLVYDTKIVDFWKSDSGTAYDSGATLYIAGVNEYQRFSKVVLEEWDDVKQEWKSKTDLSASVVKGNEGFGTYDHLLKDFRLPTAANLRWKRTMEDEMPVAGATYNEYVLHYTVDRGSFGHAAVGQLVTATTKHVFWVNSAVASEFEGFLTSWGLSAGTAKTGNGDNGAAKGLSSSVTIYTPMEKEEESDSTGGGGSESGSGGGAI